MKCFTGVVQRIISSMAVAINDGSACSRASWSGFSISACMPPLMVLEVVSWPAVAAMM